MDLIPYETDPTTDIKDPFSEDKNKYAKCPLYQMTLTFAQLEITWFAHFMQIRILWFA